MSYIQKVIDSQNNIIIICDKNCKIKRINKTFFNFFKKERAVEIVKLLKKIPFNEEIKIHIKNYKHNKYKFLVTKTAIDDDILLTLQNITKVSAYKKSLIQSNATFLEYKNLVDKFLIISKTDKKGVITYVNENFCKISGYKKEELVGRPHSIVRHKDMASIVFKNMWETILKGKIWTGIIKNRKKSGEPYFIKTMIAPIFDKKGNIKEFIAFRIDITALIKTKEKAQKAQKAKELFLANMSHEIRTPLTGIIGFIDILKEKNLPKDIKHIINIIDNSADTLLNIVNDILDLSKIETEGITIHKRQFNPKETLQSTIELFQAKAQEKNIDYSSNLNIPECIISDEHRLKQVLSNLIGNAIKFTPKNGKIQINLDKIRETEEEVEILFSVKDTGIGISPEKQNKIFKPFIQADENTTQKFGGTGLGLYISSQIVKKLGGELKVESQEHRGSNFYFKLKFKKCGKIMKTNDKNIAVTGKVLIAEDNKVNQELLKAILKLKGKIEVQIANNGREAVDIFKKEKFDLVFMDIFMPILEGTEALEEIIQYEKENNLKHTPIIALTANVLESDKKRFLENFDDYLSKPIKNEEIDRVLQKFLNINLLDKISQKMNLDKEIVENLITLYFSNINHDILMLKNNIKSNSLDDVRKIAHKIAGSSGAVDFMDIHKIAKEIENNAKDKKEIDYNKLVDKIIELVEKYKREF